MRDNRILIVSADYPISLNEELRANLVIVVWFYDVKTRDGEMVREGDIVSCPPYFVITKNRWGKADRTRRIPLELLPKVLENPEGNLDWL